MSTVESFADFIARTTAARPEQYAAAIHAAAVAHGLTEAEVSAEFDRMKAYILSYYQGVHPVRSVRDASQQIVDYVPYDQQPAARAAAAAGNPTWVAPPTPAPVSGSSGNAGESVGDEPRSGMTDAPGMDSPASSSLPPSPASTPSQPAGEVPLIRVTLARLLSLGTLDNFFRKR